MYTLEVEECLGCLFAFRSIEISIRTVIVAACYCQSDGMLKAISNATVSSRQRKLREHSIKSRDDLEKVGNRIVAIAYMNTCKR